MVRAQLAVQNPATVRFTCSKIPGILTEPWSKYRFLSQDWNMHSGLKSPLDMLFNILINRAAVPEQVHKIFQWNKTIYLLKIDAL